MIIFITYASEDHAAADELAVRLRTERHKVFLDRDVLPRGENYDARIRAAIADCELYVFLVSPHSATAGRYTQSELGFARECYPNPRGRVLPVMIADTPFADIAPYLKAVTVLQPRGDWIAETLASVAAIATARKRRRRLALGGGAVVAAVTALAPWCCQKLAPMPLCRLVIESSGSAELAGLALDITTPTGTTAYRLQAAPLEVELGAKRVLDPGWRLLLRGRDGQALGDHSFTGCPESRTAIDLGDGHAMVLSPN